MRALIYHGPGNKAWEEVPDAAIQQPTDVVVRIDTTTICGTDLHILKGDVPAVQPGRILGHEGIGTVVETGSAVKNVAVGDRVILSCISACGACSYCHQGLYAHCLADEGASGIGWIFGHLIDARVIALDLDANRLEQALTFGATDTVNSGDRDWAEQVRGMPDGLGVDVAIEAVGIPATFTACTQIVRPGGSVASAGVHGEPVELALHDLWIHDITITTGLVSTNTTPMLLKLVASGKLPAERFATDQFRLDEVMDAYDTFGRAAETKALKVVLTR
jgi:threonine dehydrogenase-like Zn-dependent dehydrogenase